MAVKIYTKTGDKGKTSLIGGTKVPKSHIRIESYGTVDELNSYIGLVSDHLTDSHAKNTLKEIQDRLFTVGSSLAAMNAVLPPMKFFVLPGGHVAVSTAHVARCVCRRAERICVQMQEEALFIDPLVIKYINRLSDYLFVLARYAGHLFQVPEIPWKPRL
jgi:cob(I)alamin adenosyltransferase